jgi:hypothetical protein
MDQTHGFGIHRQGPGTGKERRPLGIKVAVKHGKA